MAGADAEFAAELAELERRGLRRSLRTIVGPLAPRMAVEGRRGALMMASSNTLDLAHHPAVVAAARGAVEGHGVAAGGSRLISGHLECHERLEGEIARWLRKEACLLFANGYMANLGVVGVLVGAEDLVLSDSLNHASIIDACRLARTKVRVFEHNSAAALEAACVATEGQHRRRVLVIEGVNSMMGDVTDVAGLVGVARRHGLFVVLDDTHGLGVLGAQGRGVEEVCGASADVVVGNLSKSFGCFGAFVCTSKPLRELLINKARSFIFTCALPPATVEGARAALGVVTSAEGRARRERLARLAERLRAGLRGAGYDTGRSATHIVPAIIGGNDETMRVCEAALAQGVFAQGIRYPSVPKGTARLRITPMATHTDADIDEVVRVLAGLRRGQAKL